MSAVAQQALVPARPWRNSLEARVEQAERAEHLAWPEPGGGIRSRAKDRHGISFRDPVLTRHAILLASVVGCARAEAITGIHRTTISRWRRRLETQTGERMPRIPNPGNTGYGKLTLAKARKIREQRSRGVSWGVLARIHKVTRRACRLVCDGVLYPEPKT